MTNKKIEIDYQEFGSVQELEPQDRELCEAAEKALAGSYAPYSNFNVGAAVRLSDGSIVTGANQENSAYPSGLCAERTAMFAAHANHPDLQMRSIAITGAQNGLLNSGITAPCGACRQVMAEYQKVSGGKMSVLFYGKDKILKFSQVEPGLGNIFRFFCRLNKKSYICSRESRTRPAPSKLPQGRKAARVGGRSGAMC